MFMAGVEERIQWEQIQLPQPLDVNGIESLLHYVATHLPGRVDYTLGLTKRFGELHMMSSNVDTSPRPLASRVELCALRLAGSFCQRDLTTSASFRGEQSDSDPCLISTLSFSSNSDYQGNGHQPESITLIERVRSLIDQAYQERSAGIPAVRRR